MNRKPARRLSHFGSMIFGVILFGLGFAIKEFVVDAGILRGSDQVTMGRAAIGIMVFGVVIVVSNIAWAIFCVVMGRRG